jgi:predicted nuclease with TOPRIM domain
MVYPAVDHRSKKPSRSEYYNFDDSEDDNSDTEEEKLEQELQKFEDDVEKGSITTAPNSVGTSSSSSSEKKRPSKVDQTKAIEEFKKKNTSKQTAAVAVAVSTPPKNSYKEAPTPPKRSAPSRSSKYASSKFGSPTSVATFDTLQSSSSGDAMLPPSPRENTQSVIIEHKYPEEKKKGKTMKNLKMAKKPVALIIGLVFFSTAGLAYLLGYFFEIPGLNGQIEKLRAEVDRLEGEVDRLEVQVGELTVQVDRLGGEVDRLEDEVDRFEDLNDALEENNKEFKDNNQELAANNQLFKDLNAQLNVTNIEFASLTAQLNVTVFDLRDANGDLDESTLQLMSQVLSLQNFNSNLTDTLEGFTIVNQNLNEDIGTLTELNKDLDSTVEKFYAEINVLADENQRLETVLQDLTTVVSFFNDTSTELGGTLDEVADFLAEQVNATRELLMENMYNSFQQRVTNWDCGLRARFGSEGFANDDFAPIGQARYEDVIDFLDFRVLAQMCIVRNDFEAFLANEVSAQNIPVVDATVLDLNAAVAEYTLNTLEHYFTNDSNGQIGLSTTDWVNADFKCTNLPLNMRYSYLADVPDGALPSKNLRHL